MLYGTFRILICSIIFATFVLLIIKKSKIERKNVAIILTFFLSISLGFLSSIFPIENYFIDFKSPNDVFYYTCSGKIKDVVNGNDSCMVYYSTGNSSYSHAFVLKSEKGYKIAGYLSSKTISHKFDKNISSNIYNVNNTNDYYFIGTVNSKDNKIEVFDYNDEKVNTEIKKVENSDFIYFYLSNYTDKYYLLVDGNKIII